MYAVCATAYAKVNGHSCRLTDGIRQERVNSKCAVHNVHVTAACKTASHTQSTFQILTGQGEQE